jgi:NDP-sugar pyrophosphorylase family protein
MQQKLSLLILAAGMSTRFGRLKQMEPLGPNGETLLQYSIADALHAEVNRVVIVIREEIRNEFLQWREERLPKDIDVQFVIQDIPLWRQKPAGTAHALWAARLQLEGNFILINADDYYGFRAFSSLAGFFQDPLYDQNTHAFVPYPLSITLSSFGGVNRGVCEIDSHGYLQSIVETFDLIQSSPIEMNTPVSMNIWGFRPSIFKHLEPIIQRFLQAKPEKEELQLPSVLMDGTKGKVLQVKALAEGEEWFGVTYPDDKEAVAALLKHKKAIDIRFR